MLYISLSLSIPNALNNTDSGILPLKEGKEIYMDPYKYFLEVIFFSLISSVVVKSTTGLST